ncbi:MAG: MFS transporter [Acidobacteria bacterium]|nr:MFS transporter [Acidobacteriota bacterium]
MRESSHARHFVLALIFAGAVLTYLDRVAMAVAAPAIMQSLGISALSFGWVFTIFNLAYAIFEMPAAWLGDRWGQRRTLVRIVGGWSLFTALTGAVQGLGSLLSVRFVFGAAEAGAFPTMSRAIAHWFPALERNRANGIMWTGARLGGAISPVIAAWLIGALGWRTAFLVLGAVGFAWVAVWARWYRDDPARHPAVSASELALIRHGAAPPPQPGERVPWRRIIANRTMVGLFLTYFASGYGFQFFVTWLPTYLMREHGLDLKQSSYLAALPLLAGAGGSALGGVLADWLARRTGSLKWSRRGVAMAGFLGGALGFILAVDAGSARTAILCLILAAGAHDLALPVAWATCVDAGGRFGGTAGGFMNLASSLSGMLAPVSAAYIAQELGSFQLVFHLAAAVYIVGAALWLIIDTGDKDTHHATN